MFHGHLERMCILLTFNRVFYKCSLWPCWLMVVLNSSIYLLDFCLVIPPIAERQMFTKLTIVMVLSVFPFSSISFASYILQLFGGAHTHYNYYIFFMNCLFIITYEFYFFALMSTLPNINTATYFFWLIFICFSIILLSPYLYHYNWKDFFYVVYG